MTLRRQILAVVFACVIAGGCKSRSAETGATTTQGSTSVNANPTTVLMAVNLGEEDEEGGCGDVIHAVRAAARRGMPTREVDTRNEADMAAASKKYRIVVQPTVVMLDGSDHEVRRYEGETKEVIASLKADLERTAKK